MIGIFNYTSISTNRLWVTLFDGGEWISRMSDMNELIMHSVWMTSAETDWVVVCGWNSVSCEIQVWMNSRNVYAYGISVRRYIYVKWMYKMYLWYTCDVYFYS